ncbi:hypothetical protein GCM10011610_49250 [Nocardia rhizosphaerihabitans]|uniref:Uncharacterized protein n=1 Tax=Nocardia rhizosphaerihabitans TaxID=1691570 RepID=A0ABQ2KQE0_9NOCA|nr:hypothetical protein GCM10011610_49250 [Nocardia rhizosphaerihabitans]
MQHGAGSQRHPGGILLEPVPHVHGVLDRERVQVERLGDIWRASGSNSPIQTKPVPLLRTSATAAAGVNRQGSRRPIL